MFTKDWVVNDCSSHYLQEQSIKRTVSEQVSMTFRGFLPNKTITLKVRNEVCHLTSRTRGKEQGLSEEVSNEEATDVHIDP
jgi:hypothetical protein